MQAYFEGLYFKQQNERESVALIPAIHADGRGNKSASLQIITDEAAYRIGYDGMEVVMDRDQNQIAVGKSFFSPQGIVLDATGDGIRASGKLLFEGITPLAYDIMGPFVFVPGMECRHKVVSMRHCVEGELCINGKRYLFRDAMGYLEGDRGHSFPGRYLWTQCLSRDPSCSVMLSAASIPVAGVSFTGTIGVVSVGGKEHRFATYLGARVLRREGGICVRQGDCELTAELLEERGQALQAPVGGEMTRVIHESISCAVRYRFFKKGKVLLDFTSQQASFESEGWTTPGT